MGPCESSAGRQRAGTLQEFSVAAYHRAPNRLSGAAIVLAPEYQVTSVGEDAGPACTIGWRNESDRTKSVQVFAQHAEHHSVAVGSRHIEDQSKLRLTTCQRRGSSPRIIRGQLYLSPSHVPHKPYPFP